MTCAVCGHTEDDHSLYGVWCRWSKNPLSSKASVFCKCMRFVARETAA